jgi:hypothetical protein
MYYWMALLYKSLYKETRYMHNSPPAPLVLFSTIYHWMALKELVLGNTVCTFGNIQSLCALQYHVLLMITSSGTSVHVWQHPFPMRFSVPCTTLQVEEPRYTSGDIQFLCALQYHVLLDGITSRGTSVHVWQHPVPMGSSEPSTSGWHYK